MKRGDVVIVLFPHMSQTPPKRRPGLVIQADSYNQKISNVVVVSITSNLLRSKDPAHFLIDVSTSEGQGSGLLQNSLVSCINIYTMPRNSVGPKVGELSASTMAGVDHCLKIALGLP